MSGENRLVPFSLVPGPKGEAMFNLHLFNHSSADEVPLCDESGPGLVNQSPRDVGRLVIGKLLQLAWNFLGHKQVFFSSS